MSQKKSPSGDNRKGLKKGIADKEDSTRNPFAGQGFSSCVPCASCVYFKAVPLDSGRVRRLCTFHGVRVGIAGVPGCEFMQEGGVQ